MTLLATSAVLSGIMTAFVGTAVAIPSIMALDPGSTQPHMILLGISGLSIFPIGVVAAVRTITRCSYRPLLLNTIPLTGMVVAFTYASGGNIDGTVHQGHTKSGTQ